MGDKKDVKTGDSVEEKLVAAAESSTTETETTSTEESSESTEKTGENRIPQSRFNEVNEALKEERTAGERTREQLLEAQSSLVKLQELLAAKEEDVQTLNEIKSYINDPTMEEHILAIDKRLKGIQDDVESGESTPDEAMDKTRELLKATREEALDAKADVQAEALITKADIIADKLLDSLPEEYNEQDREVVSALWNAKMDESGWDAAVEAPDELSSVLTETLQETLNTYGTPRGALFSKEEIDEQTTEVTTEKTPEQELEELMGKDWGALKETTTKDGKTKFEPAISDDDFSAAMATALKHAKRT